MMTREELKDCLFDIDEPLIQPEPHRVAEWVNGITNSHLLAHDEIDRLRGLVEKAFNQGDARKDFERFKKDYDLC